MPFRHTFGNRLLHGAITDLVTPFDNGAIDRQALKTLIEWQIRGGVRAINVCGEAGEATSLSRQERSEVIAVAVECANGRISVLAGTGTNATEATIALTQDARALGADAASVVVPYYSRPTQKGILHHFRSLTQAVDIPVIICEAPAVTATELQPATIEQLSRLANIAGIADYSANVPRVAAAFADGQDLPFYCGRDGTACLFNISGGRGTFSLAANVAPWTVCALHHALETGNIQAALSLQQRLEPLLAALEIEHPVAAIKQAVSFVLGHSAEVRLPLTRISPANCCALRDALSAMPAAHGSAHVRTG